MAKVWGYTNKEVHEYQRSIFKDLPASYLKEYYKQHDKIVANPIFAEDIRWWSYGGDQQINSVLRKGGAAHLIFQTVITNIIYAIDQMPPIPKPITLYRGMVLKKFRSEPLKVGDVIEDLGLSALSSLKDVAQEFSDLHLHLQGEVPCCLFTVTIPAGTKLLHIFPSKFINEKEVLVMPGSKLRVDKALAKTGEYDATLVGFSFDATKKYDLSFPQTVVDNLSLILKKWRPVAIKGNYAIIVDGTVKIPIGRPKYDLTWRETGIVSTAYLGDKKVTAKSDIYIYCAIINLLQEGHTVEFMSIK